MYTDQTREFAGYDKTGKRIEPHERLYERKVKDRVVNKNNLYENLKIKGFIFKYGVVR